MFEPRAPLSNGGLTPMGRATYPIQRNNGGNAITTRAAHTA